MSNKIKVNASVEIIRFQKDNFAIIVCSIDKILQGQLEDDIDSNRVVFKGEMPTPKVGTMYTIIATYTDDPKFGGQYNVISMFDSIAFDITDDVSKKKFLCSLYTPNQVEEMYKVLDDPYEILKNKDHQSLVRVKGCGMKTASNWIQKFDEKQNMAKIFIELENYNLTNNMINRLVTRYKSADLVIEKVKNNPYILCDEVDGIGWKKADEIALSGGIEPYSQVRVEAYIKHYLYQCGEQGLSWVTGDELLGAVLDNIGEDLEDDVITNSLHHLDETKDLWHDEDGLAFGLMRYYKIENNIAEQLVRIQNADSIFKSDNWEEAVKIIEKRQGWDYTTKQIEGIKTALNNNITIIQGYSGTGKTSIVTALLEILKNYSYVQCALSGRAGSRMMEVTGKQGYTIHRLLGYPRGDARYQGFAFNQDNPLPYDIYILDEISMVGADIFYYLLRAVPSGAKLICLGDIGQLESIGSGNVAHDMIASGEIPVVTLTEIHRQAAKSAIITDSIKIRNGEQIISKDWTGEEIRGELKDLHIICYSDKSNTFYEIMKSFNRFMAMKDFDIMETQVIVPVKTNGYACTYQINNAIQELYNPASSKKAQILQSNSNKKPYFLREGDKVMNTKNNRKVYPAIYNGNIGILQRFDINEFGEEIMVINFKGIGIVEVPKEYWGSIELGYACTVHKYQGSECNNIVFGMDFTSYVLLNRELVYTGITRAKKECDLIAQTGALRFAVMQEQVSKKQTHLQRCLYDLIHPKLIF